MDEEEMEEQEIQKGKERFEEMIIWLSRAEIDFTTKLWENGEGRDIIINQANEVTISFYDSGLIRFDECEELGNSRLFKSGYKEGYEKAREELIDYIMFKVKSLESRQVYANRDFLNTHELIDMLEELKQSLEVKE
jgi:hypothetical protein